MSIIEFLVDENAPYSLVEFLRQRGHIVHYVGEVFPKATPDSVLLGAAEMEGFVIVTWDKDFKAAVRQMVPDGYRARAEKSAGRLTFTCKETEAEGRLRELIDLIEFHYDHDLQHGKRFIMQISLTSHQFIG